MKTLPLFELLTLLGALVRASADGSAVKTGATETELYQPTPTFWSPSSPISPSSPVESPISNVNDGKPHRKKLETCPSKYDSQDRCKVPLKCQFDKVTCCGKEIPTKSCSCAKDGNFVCSRRAIRCGPCNQSIKTCPKKFDGKAKCGIRLTCNYGKAKCCGIPSKAKTCKCQKGKPFVCRPARCIRCKRRPRVKKCPKRYDPKAKCAVPLTCKYSPTKCCGKTLHTQVCQCRKGGGFRCQFHDIKCQAECKPPKPTAILVKKCPQKPNPKTMCAVPLTCKYNPVKCCDQTVHTQVCECKKGGKLHCNRLAVRCQKCKPPKPKPIVIKTCPLKVNPKARCAVPLKCKFNPVKCCGHTVYTRECKCGVGKPLHCSNRPARCGRCIKKCPKHHHTVASCAVPLNNCHYKKVHCCPGDKGVYTQRCKCEPGLPFKCNKVHLDCPICKSHIKELDNQITDILGGDGEGDSLFGF